MKSFETPRRIRSTSYSSQSSVIMMQDPRTDIRDDDETWRAENSPKVLLRPGRLLRDQPELPARDDGEGASL